MIVDEGKVALLNAEISYLASLTWFLIAGNIADSPSNTFATAVSGEATWGGYARQSATGWQPASVPTPGGPAVSNESSLPVFLNSSGSAQTFYGWALVDLSISKLIAMTNIGAQSIPNGSSYVLAPSKTENQL